MRILNYFPVLIIFSCNNQAKQPSAKPDADTTIQSSTGLRTGKAKPYTTKDSLLISFVAGDSLTYGREEFNQIVDSHLELFTDLVQDPDLTYSSRADKNRFNSELGQDEYYMLYAYFLQQRNGMDKCNARRKKLIEIYSDINSLFQRLQHSGTYFGHQARRIAGYAEFSVYLCKSYESSIGNIYDMARKKNIYLQSLRQLIKDKGEIDFETLAQEKPARSKELNKIVDRLGRAITDNFYLGRAQEFQFRHDQFH